MAFASFMPATISSSFLWSTKAPYNGGIIAPPEIAMINKADAVFVNLPKPVNAKGQIAGHTKAFAIPKAATKRTDVNPEVYTIQNEQIIPKIALAFNAKYWLLYLGIKSVPNAYITTIAIKVNNVKNLASSTGMFKEIP